jgi:hypothetical protein
MAVEQVLESLASDAGQAVVTAAASDAWGWAKKAFARLLGHGNTAKAERYEGRLEVTHQELAAAVPAGDLEQTRARLAAAWQTRILDLLEEQPGLAEDLRTLVEQVQAAVPGSSVAAEGHGIAVGHDMNITASGNAVAAGTVQGNVSTGNPTVPGPANA